MKPWLDKLKRIDPYVPGEQSKNKNIIKLNANENPYPPSPKALKAIRNAKWDNLNLYPDSDAMELKAALARHHRLEPNQVFVGNGSDDVLAIAFMACFNSEMPILFPDITYSFYSVWCSLFGIAYDRVPLMKDLSIDPMDYYRVNGGIVLPNPNAPTGIGENKEFIIDVLNHNKENIVIIDEAYVDFGCYSSIELLKNYENLLIVQTFSKSRSLAGLRIGAAFGSPEMISALESVKNSYNSYAIDSISLKAGTAAVEDDTYFRDTLSKIISTREWCVKELEEIGFKSCPSQANFVFVTHETIKVKVLFEYLRDRNILVRYFNLPRIDNYLRITIGTNYEMETLISAIKKFISEMGQLRS